MEAGYSTGYVMLSSKMNLNWVKFNYLIDCTHYMQSYLLNSIGIGQLVLKIWTVRGVAKQEETYESVL